MVVVVLILGYGVAVDGTNRGHYDHFLFLQTVSYMDHGASYYDAFEAAYQDLGVTIGRATAIRPPAPFLLWWALPAQLLYASFLVLVVFGSSVLALGLTRRPWIVLVLTAFLLLAGRPARGTGGVTEYWLLVELWCVPLVLGCLLAWRTRRDGIAAACALGATAFREIAVVLLIGGLLAAWRAGRPIKPWVVATAAATTYYAIHFAIATTYARGSGNEAQLFGTADLPSSVLDMIWTLALAFPVGVALLVLAVMRLLRKGELILMGPLFALPLAGLVVDRPYWGFLFSPLMLLLASDELGDHVHAARSTSSATG